MPTLRELVTVLTFKVDESGIKSFNNSLRQSIKKTDELTFGIRTLANDAQAFAKRFAIGVSAPVAAFSGFALKAASDSESARIAFNTMLGSAEEGGKFVEQLTAFAAKTPFTIPGIRQSATGLLGIGIESSKVIPTLKALGDVSAGLNVPLERLALNYGQVKAQSKLTGVELRDFQRAGVPIISELAKNLNVSEDQVKVLASQSKISFDDVEEAFISMTSEGGRFFDLMIAQSATLGGKFSNLEDTFSSFRSTFGQMLSDELRLKKFLELLSDGLEKVKQILDDLSPVSRKILSFFTLALIIIPPVTVAILALIPAMLALNAGLIKLGFTLKGFLLIGGKIALIAALLFLFLDDLSTWVSGGDSLLGEFFGNFDDFRKKIIDALSNLGDAFKAFFVGNFEGFVESLEKFNDKIVSIIDGIITGFEKIFGTEGTSVLRFIAKSVKTGAETAGSLVGAALGTNDGSEAREFFDGVNNGLGQLFTRAQPANFNNPINNFPTPALAGTANTNINVNSKVEVAVPEGTTSEQRRFINEDVRKVVKDEFGKQFQGVINANQEAE